MLLENIFATAMILLLLTIALISSVNEVKAFERKIFFYSVMSAFFISGAVTIITAIIWIWRAFV